VSPSRTVLIGSALPVLVLVGLVGFPSALLAIGPRWADAGASQSRSLTPRPGPPSTTPAAVEPVTDRVVAARPEARALGWLRRSILNAGKFGFTGTEVTTTWYGGSSTTRRLRLIQRPGGERTATGQDGAVLAADIVATDPPAVLSTRALAALAAGYDLRVSRTGDVVAGRRATVIVAGRGGRVLATLWLDDQTGLVLRQEIRDRSGRLRRTAAFLTLKPMTRSSSAPAKGPVAKVVTASGRTGSDTGAAATIGTWNDVTLADRIRWRAAGWPCPEQLANGFVLLAARQGRTAAGAPILQLTYGDGLSSVSVFLQRGRLDTADLKGLSSQKWGSTPVQVRAGWPAVMVWQGGPTVITAVGDAEPADLRSTLAVLPRQPNRGTLDSLRHEMGSALAWIHS